MIHYHGTPITPLAALYSLAGSAFCVSIVEPKQLRRVHKIGRGVMLDNGAFSAWTKQRPTNWPKFYHWCEPWLSQTTWAVIPDVIEGDEAANDNGRTARAARRYGICMNRSADSVASPTVGRRFVSAPVAPIVWSVRWRGMAAWLKP